MNYLLSTRILGFKFEEVDKLEIIMNASFVNDISNQKSSQEYAIRFLKGLIV